MLKLTHLMERSKGYFGRNAPQSLFEPNYIFLGCQHEFQAATELELCLFCFYFLPSRYFYVCVSCLYVTKKAPLVVAMIETCVYCLIIW